MYFPHPALAHEPSHVLRIDPASGEDLDPAARLNDEPVNPAGTFGRRGRSTRGQHALHAQPNQTLERRREIGTDIECAMKRYRQRPRGSDQRCGLFASNLARRRERAGHNPVRPCVLRLANLLERRSMLCICVHEVARAGTNQHKHRN